jgi:acyl carrier protein
MATSPTSERVQHLFVEALNKEAPAVETDLIEGGLLDSLALVELIFAIEREFGVTIPLEELEIDSFRSVASIADFVAGTAERAS